jgi:hypothetical protein
MLYVLVTSSMGRPSTGPTGAGALTGADVVVEGTVRWLEPEAAAGAAGSSVLVSEEQQNQIWWF